MTHPPSCPACTQPFDAHASRFPPMSVEGMSVIVCGNCTCMSTAPASRRVEDHYRARVWGGAPRAEFTEDEDGAVRLANAEVRNARAEAKLQALRAAVRVTKERAPSVVEVGCRSGAFIRTAQRRFEGLRVSAAEPWLPWRDEAARRGVSVDASTAEALEPGRYDLAIEFDLLDHFSDPLAHLRVLAALLKPGGHVLLGVTNIAACSGMLYPHKLRLDTPVGFTRRALRHACAAAGLSAAIWEDGSSLFAVCERGSPVVPPATPGDAAKLVLSMRENDGRLLLKRVLAEHGPTDAVIRAAKSALRGFRSDEARRALSIDVARACARAGHHAAAAQWLERGHRRIQRRSQDVA